MRMSTMFSRTLREAPADAQTIGHALLVRAGFIQQHAAGIFSALPLGLRALHKVEAIIREEIDAIGGQEIKMPVINPASIWQETDRYYTIGSEMARFVDRTERPMVLAMTHEEVVTDLVRNQVESYRQLPALVYHIQTKWRDDPRPRAGLIRVREFTMKDSYSLDVDEEGLDRQYKAHYQAYFNIFRRCSLDPIAVGSDTGMMGGSMAHEFMVLTPIGEDTLLLCGQCGYAANRQIARCQKSPTKEESEAPIEKVVTPGVTTISDLATFLNVPESKTAKAVLMVATVSEAKEDVERLVFAVVRGDMSVNETKLANAVRAKELRPATDVEIRAIGAEPGYASPIGVHDAVILVDDAVVSSPNLVAGANEAGFHLRNVNYGRDFEADIVCDLVAAEEGSACPMCGARMRARRGVEVGNIFKLGTRYSAAMGATFVDEEGESYPVVMGSYGIGVGRALACVAETHNDDYGLIWPITIAPYAVHLVTLGPEGSRSREAAEQLYMSLQEAGIDVLYDDRDRSAGVKFNDADLLGMPIRLTVARRGMKQHAVEMKLRDQREQEMIPFGDILNEVETTIESLKQQINAAVVGVPFDA